MSIKEGQIGAILDLWNDGCVVDSKMEILETLESSKALCSAGETLESSAEWGSTVLDLASRMLEN